MDWPVLVLLGIVAALAGIAVWSWLRRRELDAGAGPAHSRDPIAVPVEPRAPEPPEPVVAAASPDAPGDADSPFGPGSARSFPDGSGPAGWTIKGNADSGLYHTQSSPSWGRMHAEVWFETEDAAIAAGFKRWDWRRTTSAGTPT
jgi:uncharacterized membrane protein ArfC